MSTEQTASGSCLCGAVSYGVSGPLRPIMYCHCEQCRRTSGHYVAATACVPAQINLSVDRGLEWFRSSADAQRGFCKVCGSSMFWRPDHGRYWSIFAGTLDRPTGLKATSHIHVHMASDYYDIDDGLPQFEDRHPSSFSGDFE